MKKWMTAAMAAALICACMLTACGNDPVEQEAEHPAETTSAETETTAPETTADTTDTTTKTETTETTAASEEEDAAETTGAPAEEESPSENQVQQDNVNTEQPGQVFDQPVIDMGQQNQQQEAPQQEIIWDVLRVNGSVANYLSSHTDYSFEEADSCMGEGKDRVYTYADRVIMTYYFNGNETLIELDILEPGILTRKDIGVGSSVGELEAAYGGPDATGAYLFQTEDGTLEFMTDGGTVTFIALYE